MPGPPVPSAHAKLVGTDSPTAYTPPDAGEAIDAEGVKSHAGSVGRVVPYPLLVSVPVPAASLAVLLLKDAQPKRLTVPARLKIPPPLPAPPVPPAPPALPPPATLPVKAAPRMA